jgi:hypothetical protein
MNQFLKTAIAISLLAGMTACGTSPSSNSGGETPANSLAQPAIEAKPTPTVAASPTPATTAKPVSPAASTVPTPEPSSATSSTSTEIAAATAGTREVTVYRLDDQCQDYVPEKLTVPNQGTADAIVGRVLAKNNSPDFRVSNYRVDVQDGVATVDLNLPTDSPRTFQSMSTCEQMGILGSLEKTLTGNPALRIQAVKFTDGKKELQF